MSGWRPEAGRGIDGYAEPSLSLSVGIRRLVGATRFPGSSSDSLMPSSRSMNRVNGLRMRSIPMPLSLIHI